MIWCVCLVLHHGNEVLMIREEEKLTFPGGKTERYDRTLFNTARREFCEEVCGMPEYDFYNEEKIDLLFPAELHHKIKTKMFVEIIKPPTFPSKNPRREAKDSAYWIIEISRDLLRRLVREKNMVTVQARDLPDLATRKRETKKLKVKIVETITKQQH